MVPTKGTNHGQYDFKDKYPNCFKWTKSILIVLNHS